MTASAPTGAPRTRWLVRGVSASILVVAAIVSGAHDVSEPAPDYALGNGWVLRAEILAAIAVLLSGVLLLAVRGVVQGTLPSRISGEGLEYRVEGMEGDLAAAVKTLQDQLAEILEQDAEQSATVGLLAAEVDALRTRLPRGSETGLH